MHTWGRSVFSLCRMGSKEFKTIEEQIEILKRRGYSISELKIQSAVADAFGLRKKGAELLKSFMHSLTIIRNLCAHGSRLFNRLFEQKPWLNKKELSLLRVKDGVIDNAHLFGFVLIMKRLLKPEEFDSMKKEIINLSEKISFVSLRYYGFCDNWQDIL